MKKQFPLEEISTWVYNGCIKAQNFAWMSNIGIADTERNPSMSSNLLFSKFSVIYYFGIYWNSVAFAEWETVSRAASNRYVCVA